MVAPVEHAWTGCSWPWNDLEGVNVALNVYHNVKEMNKKCSQRPTKLNDGFNHLVEMNVKEHRQMIAQVSLHRPPAMCHT